MAKKILTFNDFDLSHVPEVLLMDTYWRRCIEVALRGGGKDQRYGAQLVKGDKVLGEGRSRLLPKGEPFPINTSFFLHAEVDAIGDGIKKHGKRRIMGATVYVAGLFVKERRLIIFSPKMTSTCSNCAKHYPEFELNVAFPSSGGWIVNAGRISYENTIKNRELMKQQGISKREFRLAMAL